MNGVHHNIAAKPIESPSSNLVSGALTEPRDLAEGRKKNFSRATTEFETTTQSKIWSSCFVFWNKKGKFSYPKGGLEQLPDTFVMVFTLF